MADRTRYFHPEGGTESLLWEAALDSNESAAIVFDPEANRIHQISQGMVRLTGLPGYQLYKHKVSGLFPDQLSELVGLTQACLEQGEVWSDNFSILTSGGQDKPIEIFASTFNDRDRTFILFVCFDLKRMKNRRYEAEFNQMMRGEPLHSKHLEGMFRNLERGNRLILDAAGEGIYGVDAEGKTTFINPAAERMLGWRADELVGRVMHHVVHYSHEDGSPYSIKCCPIYAAFRDGAVHRVDNEVFWRKDGTSLPVEYTSTPICHGGRMIGAVIVFRDISERRNTESDLKNALAEVEKLKKRLEQENAYLQDELSEEYKHGEIVGKSHAVKQVLGQIALVAPTDANVLITGESGTGKELIARAIHKSSTRSERPLIRVNCAAIPRELFESEFFGHAKGAFTGAVGERIGRFELADGGTIFLDEIGEIPLDQQPKFLRVLQEQQFERLGGTKTRNVDVRVIAATNRDLKQAVRDKEFREDLYFRLNVFPIEAVPLRERIEDIPPLATHFVQRACQRFNKPQLSVSLADIKRLQDYAWPGNIRELENFIERAVIISTGEKLHVDPQTLSAALSPCDSASVVAHSESDRLDTSQEIDRTSGFNGVLTEKEIHSHEKNNIVQALRTSKGKVSGAHGAAALLSVKPTTLYSRLKRYGINARDYR